MVHFLMLLYLNLCSSCFKGKMKLAVVIACVICTSPLLTYQQQFNLPEPSPASYPVLQVDREGRAFVATGNQLFRLSKNLLPEQNITLLSRAVKISLSPGGEKLVVCTADLSCVVYATSDLSTPPQVTNVTLVSDDHIALFTSGTSFYTGSANATEGTIRLSHGYVTNMNMYSEHTKDYAITVANFKRNFTFGFSSGNYSYFIALDNDNIGGKTIRILRAGHDPSCCSSETGSCSFTALYEDTVPCSKGSIYFLDDEYFCDVSLIEDFGRMNGPSIVLSKCRGGVQSVCFFSIANIDKILDSFYNKCSRKERFQHAVEQIWKEITHCDMRNVRFVYNQSLIIVTILFTLNRGKAKHCNVDLYFLPQLTIDLVMHMQ